MLFGNNQNVSFHANELIYITSGEYSSFGVFCVARVLKDFDARSYVKQESYADKLDTARLFADGVLEEIEARELWTGTS